MYVMTKLYFLFSFELKALNKVILGSSFLFLINKNLLEYLTLTKIAGDGVNRFTLM